MRVAVSEGSLENFDQLHDLLGRVPLERIRLQPAPGTATEEDVLAARREPGKRLCELVDGVLVEKPMGSREAFLAGLIIAILWEHLRAHRLLGIVLGADGALKLLPKLVRIPDVAYIADGSYAGRPFPQKAIADLAPDLAVEVLSEGNTPGEMKRKVRDYLLSGTQVIWVIDPRKRSARVYRAGARVRKIPPDGILDGEPVLPGFQLSLKELFTTAEERRVFF